MKYIRTKDSILVAPELYDNGGVVLYSDPPQYETRNAKNEWGCIECSKVIKSADTIEELCDEFVGEKNDYHYKLELIDGKFYTLCSDNQLRTVDITFNIYGAIWTDKGLIYVAKMNEKGELELL